MFLEELAASKGTHSFATKGGQKNNQNMALNRIEIDVNTIKETAIVRTVSGVATQQCNSEPWTNIKFYLNQIIIIQSYLVNRLCLWRHHFSTLLNQLVVERDANWKITVS